MVLGYAERNILWCVSMNKFLRVEAVQCPQGSMPGTEHEVLDLTIWEDGDVTVSYFKNNSFNLRHTFRIKPFVKIPGAPYYPVFRLYE